MNEGPWANPSFPLWFGFLPTLQGLLLFEFEAINLFWSSVFGLGGHAVEWIAPPHRAGAIDVFGILVWPILMWLALFRLGERVQRLPARSAAAVVGAYAASLCVVVSHDGILTARLGGRFAYEWLPLYFRLLAY